MVITIVFSCKLLEMVSIRKVIYIHAFDVVCKNLIKFTDDGIKKY
jgi:hypothetical protein